MRKKHWAIFIDNHSDKEGFLELLLGKNPPFGFEELHGQSGSLFSKLALEAFIDEEERHGQRTLSSHTAQSLKTMSSGEQKKALLQYILGRSPGFIVLDNPFDNLDSDSQEKLKTQLRQVAETTSIVQIISRRDDLLPFIDTYARLDLESLVFLEDPTGDTFWRPIGFKDRVPAPLNKINYGGEVLAELRKVNVSYFGKTVLKNICWTIKKGEFWELRGKNGSGKTTILSMITGENPKGYGQELYIFGRKKGSGESVWDIKKRMGYFTPSMTDKFTGYHSVEHMVISGLNDSIGLYLRPTEAQSRLAREWLQLIDMWHLREALYHDLSMGQKRLIMCIRAMIKHPVLLILDEPTAGLDDPSAQLFVSLVNKFSRESDTTLIFVSHRREPGLEPNFIYQLEMSPEGSVGNKL